MTELAWFEGAVRAAAELRASLPAPPTGGTADEHPFEVRDVHPSLHGRCRQLYDSGFYPEAAFEAFKFVEELVKKRAGLKAGSGFKLMMQVFNEDAPLIALNELQTESHTDEQRGYRHMFAGAQSAIRNPRGHGTDLVDSPDDCLDHVSVASVLLRRLDAVEEA